MKHVAFCKVGKSVKFNSAYSPIGGDNEAPAMLALLANNNPEIVFHMVGRSDLYKMSETAMNICFPHKNVRDAFEGHRGKADPSQIINYWKKLGFDPDLVVMMVGQAGSVTIPDRIQKVKSDGIPATVIDMTKNYVTPIFQWWNDNPQLKVIEIINDPRYCLKMSRDIINNPAVSLSQYNYIYEKNSIKSYEDQTRTVHKIPVRYASMERIFQYNNPVPPIDIENRKVPFMVVLNEGRPSRYPILNEWVLGSNNGIEVWGKWDETIIGDDPRFKGTMKIDDLHEHLTQARSTFIVPIKKGWATSKYLEMIHNGVIPFMHPSYDEQNNCKLPNWLRVKSPAQLVKWIKSIEDDRLYLAMIKTLQKQYCTKEFFDGSYINNEIFSSIVL